MTVAPASPRIRVLWLIKGLGPGGAERLLVSIAGAADHHLFDYHAGYLLSSKDQLVAELEGEGVTVHRFGSDRRGDLRWLLRLWRLLRTEGFDVVHVHSPFLAVIARVLVRGGLGRRRPTLIYTEHNVWSAYGRPTRWANCLTYGLDDVHLAVSEAARQSVGRRWRDGVEVVVHGIPIQQVAAQAAAREASRFELGITPDQVVIGTVANHRREKDYPTLLAAARTVLDSAESVQFVAVGQGPLTKAIEAEHRRLGLGDRFRLLGYRDDAVRVMAAADVFTLSSIQEGYPVALMEALALGLPVVATNVGGISDAIHEGLEGELVPPGRPDLLARAVLRMVQDPSRRAQTGRAARERALEFDVQRAALSIEKVYLNSAASKG